MSKAICKILFLLILPAFFENELMEENWCSRTELLLGREGLNKLRRAHVLVVGLGGVGAPLAEHLCRSGIGEMTIVDGDKIHESNRNRQLLALTSTNDHYKTEVLAGRFREINPEIRLHICTEFLRDQPMIDLLKKCHYDYVADAIDTLSPKVFLIYHSLKNNIPLVSSMGSGGKMDPLQIRSGDISDTVGCPMARAIRKRLHKLDIHSGFKAVYSPEAVPEHAVVPIFGEQNKKSNVGTISYMPALFGGFMASVIIRDILKG